MKKNISLIASIIFLILGVLNIIATCTLNFEKYREHCGESSEKNICDEITNYYGSTITETKISETLLLFSSSIVLFVLWQKESSKK